MSSELLAVPLNKYMKKSFKINGPGHEFSATSHIFFPKVQPILGEGGAENWFTNLQCVRYHRRHKK
jgi:hypothetical protein